MILGSKTTHSGRGCRHCGAVIPGSHRDGLCPACLLSGALDLDPGEAKTLVESEGIDAPLGPSELPCNFGGYRLLGRLGQGGMGTVYEAEDLTTGRRVALKTIGRQLDSSEMRQRFIREGRLAAGLNHPHSLYVFGSEEIEGLPVITMEIAAAGTLQDRLQKKGPLPIQEAVDAILDVISGLESAIGRGVLHRDIKPSNCFVCADGSVKVGDFGLSVSTLGESDSLVTTLGRIMGTPAYASPEQLRGDTLDVRSDIYSVGATLYTLLTNRPPFEGENAVQVVLSAVSEKPVPLTEIRKGVPPGLARVVERCLAKEPAQRYSNYTPLRNALLPYSSKEPEPASLKVRASAGWFDYLIAFLIPYVILVLSAGNEEFHFRLFLDQSWYSARHYLTFLGCGFLYFTLAEGIWGAGLGKRLKGLRVIRRDGGRPGLPRAFLRILVPVLACEGFRVPFLMVAISATRIDELTISEIVIYSVVTILAPWIPVLLSWRAGPQNRFTTPWDAMSGTRVVVKPRSLSRPSIEPSPERESDPEGPESLGPFQILRDVIPGKWMIGADPVLQRRLWLLRRESSGLSAARRNLARSTRLRWLQEVKSASGVWDVFEVPEGVPLRRVVKDNGGVAWSTLRHWLHDLASELWIASGDQTLPDQLSLDQVWIRTDGAAVLLDQPWPEVGAPAETFPAEDLDHRLSFLDAVGRQVEPTSLPLHARPVLQNLEEKKFEKLSFLAGILRGLLEKPAEVTRGLRGASLFMIPVYHWIMIFFGTYTGQRGSDWYGTDAMKTLLVLTVFVLGSCALVQLLEIPLRTTASHSIFRLAVIDSEGKRASRTRLLQRWAFAWLPLLLVLPVLFYLFSGVTMVICVSAAILLWLGGVVHAALHPHRGLQDRLAGTWVVRR